MKNLCFCAFFFGFHLFSIASTAMPSQCQIAHFQAVNEDSLSAPTKTKYLCWIYPKLKTPIPRHTNHPKYKGRLVAVTDSSVIFEAKRPSKHWAKIGAYYEVKSSQIEAIAFRKKGGFLRVFGLVFGIALVFGIGTFLLGKRQQARCLADPNNKGAICLNIGYLFMPSILAHGLIGGLILGSRRKKVKIAGSHVAFSENRNTLSNYAVNRDATKLEQ